MRNAALFWRLPKPFTSPYLESRGDHRQPRAGESAEKREADDVVVVDHLAYETEIARSLCVVIRVEAQAFVPLKLSARRPGEFAGPEEDYVERCDPERPSDGL